MNVKDWIKQAKENDYYHVGKGWSEILTTLCDKIIAIDPTIEVLQVKEKFGGLRFYTGGLDVKIFEEVLDLMNEAEQESFKTCEQCGTKENVTTKGSWILTLCNKCRKERDVESDNNKAR